MPSKRLSWEEIQKRYPDRWVGLIDVKWRNQSNIEEAVVKYTDRTSAELLELQLDNEPDLISCYTTPDNIAFVGVTA